MLKLRVLTSVSVVALATAAGISGAQADNLTTNISPAPNSVVVAAGSSAAVLTNEQVNQNSVTKADPANLVIGFPDVVGQSHDFSGGGGNTIDIGENDMFTVAIGNQTKPSTGSPTAGQYIDFFVAENGGVAGDTSAATIGSLQINLNNDVIATLDNGDIQADVIDLGAGSSISVSDNTITGRGTGNDSNLLVAGNVNQLQNSTQFGQAEITAGTPALSAGATALSGNVQANLGTQSMEAAVTDSRIGLLARTDDATTALVGIPLDVANNVIAASFVGNNASVGVNLGADEAVTLVGTAGAANVQVNDGDFDITAEVRDTIIEVGDTDHYVGTKYIGDIDGGSINLTNNQVSASATSNNASNYVVLADGLSQAGQAGTGDQLNTVDFGGAPDNSHVNGDLFIANAQYSTVAVSATVDLATHDSTMNVLTEDLTGASILADDNLITAAATGSAVLDELQVGNATSFDSLVGINSLQYTEGTQTATNESLITVDTASTAPDSDGIITKTGISVDKNEESAQATGNSHASSIDIKGTTLTGPSDNTSGAITSDRSATKGGVDADLSILSAQVLDGGSASANLTTGIDVDAADIEFTTANLSVSTNDIHGQAIGNLSTNASISLDAVSIDSTAAVANSQTVEDSALLSSVITANGPAFIDVDVAAGRGGQGGAITVDNANVNVDGNTFDSRVWGNLANAGPDAPANSISVTGVTVDDHGLPYTEVGVDRSGPVANTNVSAGIALLNDQSVEDLNTSTVIASANGNLINLTIGDNADLGSSVTNSNFSADSNSATTSATLNQATSAISVDAVTNSAGTALTNVQTLTDQDGVDGSAQIKVDQNNLDITIDVIAGDEALSKLNVTANGNETLAAARINLATNTLDVKAQTEVADGVLASGINSVSVDLDTTPFTRGANLLVNDQAFLNLGAGGVVVNVNDNDITIDLSVADDDVLGSTVQVNNNSINALAAGNDATNKLSLEVGNVDLSKADVISFPAQPGVPSNGPLANLVSNQWGQGGDGGGFTTNINDATIAIDANTTGGDTTDVTKSTLSADGNTVHAQSRANNVANTLSATGTTLENNVYATPTAVVTDLGGIITEDTTLVLASRQVNSVDIASKVSGTAISVEAGSPFGGNGAIDDDLEASTLTANSNLVESEARGSDGANLLALDFTTNEGQAFVTNLQYADQDVSYKAATVGTEISVMTNVGGQLDKSALSASGNAVVAVASANRSNNELDSSGTNVTTRNGSNTVTFDPTATDNFQVLPNPGTKYDAPLVVESQLAVINVQGNGGIGGAESDVSAITAGTLIGVISEGLVENGAINADNNAVLAQATQHNAVNTLNITASANIGADGIDSNPGASVVSLQTISDDDDTKAAALFTGIVAYGEDPRSAGSFAASASDNQITASAIGGTAINTLSANAKAALDGNSGSSPITGGTDPTIQVNAGYNVLNMQFGDGATMAAAVGGAVIFAGSAEDYNNDAVTVSGNTVSAEARGFVAQNVLSLKAGSSSDATATVANVQQLDSSTVDSDVLGVAILTGNLGEGAINSALTVDDNTVEAIAGGNRAVNQLVSSAGATLQESSGAGVTSDPAGVSRLSVTGADYAVLNDQSTDNATITANIGLVGITVDGLNATTGVNNSSIGVEGNQVLASAVGNDAVNQLVLNTGTYEHPSAAIANIQTNNGSTISANVDGVVIGVGGLATLDATSSNSSIRVRGNSIGATAIGNSATSIISGGN